MSDYDRDYDFEATLINPTATIEALRAEAEVAHERLPVTRRGDRNPLPRWLRILVLRRDLFECQWCHARDCAFEIDHILPWSAGGSDASWNLRTLCRPCNQKRSNHRTDVARARALPIILTCVGCDDGQATDDGSEPRNAWCSRCGHGTTSTQRQIDCSPASAVVAS